MMQPHVNTGVTMPSELIAPMAHPDEPGSTTGKPFLDDSMTPERRAAIEERDRQRVDNLRKVRLS